MNIPIIISIVSSITISIILIFQFHRKNYNRRQIRGILPIAIGSFVIILNIFDLFKGDFYAEFWLIGILAILYGFGCIYLYRDSKDDEEN